jgi:uncharacterized protein
MTAPAAPSRRRPFLTARWESLVLLNYPCRREWLEPLVPSGTALDTWQGDALVSLVGFLFTDTRLLGVPVPFHRTFEEVNLRFYVRRPGPDGAMRRAVVFIRELVPRVAIAWTARAIYNEPYLAVPMSHRITLDPERGGHVRYGWRHRHQSFTLDATTAGAASPLEPGSEAEFITEHYWGYTRQRDGGTLEYEVVHPPWRVWTATDHAFSGDATALYGAHFADLLRTPPRSAFVAVGSAVEVHVGRTIQALT